ncbi:uncharacterized protein BO88DRAFT_430579 [Aspergillus vadensis CBS 113365]|uniref:Uncharacterized protein n=1 Tax=Aspergillus vadensis (strain CBS 113365 / IMI 142717 / IBT 24658) TaxID=1448311 RepID=A0A319ASM8_ASPVC|nr:hypothetical protein BO88DRAFT_430579 [Aspergillus vadensis CBS 113365]PYH63337.1 hypothetical protein BO88DRAFT_430579 [Aspergillus vadensis CBS 113365]
METGGRRRVEGEQEFFSSFWGGRNLKRREDAGCQDYSAILLTAQAELPSHCPGRSLLPIAKARRSYQCPLLIATAGSGGLELNSTAFAAGGSPDWVRLSLTSSGGSVGRESDVGAESRDREREEVSGAGGFSNSHSQARPSVSLPITSFLFRRLYYSPSTLLLPLRCPSFSRNIGAPP